MLKGSYTAIIASVIVHILLLLALIFSSINAPEVIKQEKTKVSAIKSFLYKAPKKAPQKSLEKLNKTDQLAIKSTEKIVQQAEQTKPVPAKEIKNLKQSEISPPPIREKEKAPSGKLTEKPLTPASKKSTTAITKQNKGTAKASFSSYDRLSRLRENLNNQRRNDAFAELTQQRSASIMDGEQIPVPETIVPLTREQKYKQNTSKSHVSSITKNDNGTCTIHREQILGSPVLASTSYFGCGESKFDKSFREHMQKVKAKLNVPKK